MDNITSRAESKRYVQSTSQNSLPNNLELDFWHFYSLAFQLGLSLFCNYKVLKMVRKSLGNSPNSSKNSVATLNQLKNVVQTGDRQQTQCSALCFASWSRHMMGISVLWLCSCDQVMFRQEIIQKFCQRIVTFRLFNCKFAKKTPVTPFSFTT